MCQGFDFPAPGWWLGKEHIPVPFDGGPFMTSLLVGFFLAVLLVRCWKRARLRTRATLAAGTLALLLGAAARAGLFVGAPGPTGTLRVSRPTLFWRIWPSGQTSITGGEMTINGQPVAATYSPELPGLVFRPSRPLAAGSYQVDCRAIVDEAGGQDTRWRFSVPENVPAEAPAPGAAQRGACDAVNECRRMFGLPALRIDARLCASAAAHSEYLRKNWKEGQPGTPHQQIAGRPGYTGTGLKDRTEVFDYPLTEVWEDIVQHPGDSSLAGQVRELFAAPYHREPFMEPHAEDVGAGAAGSWLTLHFGRTSQLRTPPPALVLCPAPGLTGVPLAFPGHEHPDPLRIHGVKAPVGFVISFFYFVPGDSRIRVTAASLVTQADGNPVPFLLNTPANDDQLTNGAFLIPRQPLKPGTVYQVSMSAVDAQGRPLARTWSFTTRGREGPSDR